jgi:hypothetical protein
MRRYRLFEWGDQPWLPRVFRDFITDHLHYGLTEKLRRPINRRIARQLKSLLQHVDSGRIIDLCAGAGGPLLTIQRILRDELQLEVDVTLTDLYPNVAAFQHREREGEGRVQACYQSVDAFNVPVELAGLRTLFTSLHHFDPEQVRLILADAARKRQPIAIFEPLERSWRMVLKIGAFSLYQSFVLTPRVSRLTGKRFLLTYVVPLCPACMLWDGMVSALRTYKPEELRQITHGIGGTEYGWEADTFVSTGPLGFTAPTTYLIGRPLKAIPTQAARPQTVIAAQPAPMP